MTPPDRISNTVTIWPVFYESVPTVQADVYLPIRPRARAPFPQIRTENTNGPHIEFCLGHRFGSRFGTAMTVSLTCYCSSVNARGASNVCTIAKGLL